MKVFFICILALTLNPLYAQLRNLQTNGNNNVSTQEGVIQSPQDAIAAARKEIHQKVQTDKVVGFKFIRLGFHDCVGGCDGCVDLLNPDNKGLDYPVDLLDVIVAKYAVQGVTRADIWALAAMTAADVLKSDPGVIFSFNWYGRPTCDNLQFLDPCQDDDCSATRGPKREMPSPDLDTHGILAYFNGTFGFDAQETTALMGAHSIGFFHRQNSGFDNGSWSRNPALLDNSYYQALVGPEGLSPSSRIKRAPKWMRAKVNNSDIPGMPNRHEWKFLTFVMMNADISLVRDFSGKIDGNGRVTCSFRGEKRCPVAVDTFDQMIEFRDNNTMWLEEFRDVFTFMLEFPFNPTAPCNTGPCYIGAGFI